MREFISPKVYKSESEQFSVNGVWTSLSPRHSLARYPLRHGYLSVEMFGKKITFRNKSRMKKNRFLSYFYEQIQIYLLVLAHLWNCQPYILLYLSNISDWILFFRTEYVQYFAFMPILQLNISLIIRVNSERLNISDIKSWSQILMVKSLSIKHYMPVDIITVQHYDVLSFLFDIMVCWHFVYLIWSAGILSVQHYSLLI